MKPLTDLFASSGPSKTQALLASLRYHASERYHEWRFGVRTHSGLFRSRRKAPTPGMAREAADYATLFKLFGALNWIPGREVFLELGCRRGRALLIAALQPVRRVIGIEPSRELCATARRNVQRAIPRLRCRDIEILRSDLHTLIVPPAPLTVFIGVAPAAAILRAVFENLCTSHRARPRPIRVILGIPAADDATVALATEAGLRLTAAETFPNGQSFQIWEVAGT